MRPPSLPLSPLVVVVVVFVVLSILSMAQAAQTDPLAAIEPLTVMVDGKHAILPVSRDVDMRHRAAAFCIVHGIGDLRGCTSALHQAAVARLAVAANSSCASRNLVVVAHPDDETIFGFHSMLRAAASLKGGSVGGRECYTIVCVTGGAEPAKRLQFETAMLELGRTLQAAARPMTDAFVLERFEMWAYHDCIDCVPFRLLAPSAELLEAHYLDTIETDLLREVGRFSFNKLISHNVIGEYGHPQHRELHAQVSKALQMTRHNDTTSFHVFQPFTIESSAITHDDPRSTVLQAYSRLSSTLGFWEQVSAHIVPISMFDRDSAVAWCREQEIPESSGMILSCR